MEFSTILLFVLYWSSKIYLKSVTFDFWDALKFIMLFVILLLELVIVLLYPIKNKSQASNISYQVQHNLIVTKYVAYNQVFCLLLLCTFDITDFFCCIKLLASLITKRVTLHWNHHLQIHNNQHTSGREINSAQSCNDGIVRCSITPL